MKEVRAGRGWIVDVLVGAKRLQIRGRAFWEQKGKHARAYWQYRGRRKHHASHLRSLHHLGRAGLHSFYPGATVARGRRPRGAALYPRRHSLLRRNLPRTPGTT